MVSELLMSIFRTSYDSSSNNLDEVLIELKKNGATQSVCTFILATELNMRLPIADNIVLNSIAWKNSKVNTFQFRNELGEFLERTSD